MDGLSATEAAARRATFGPNALIGDAPARWWRTLLAQLKSPVIGLLLAATGIAALLRDWVDAAAIGVIVGINALVGFFQEFRAERAVRALQTLAAPRATVRRDGKAVALAAAEVVPGDVLLLEAGDVVAADARLVRAHALRTNEAALTGESFPVDKVPGRTEGAPLAERSGEVFSGTSVVTGTAEAEVTATGMKTQLGRIAGLLATAEEPPTPLEQSLARTARTLLWLCLAVVGAVAALGLWRGETVLSVALASVSLAVAAVPEGLPAIVTVALSIGLRRMAQRHVLVRRLPAVESLGCASVICTDKTGTLTTGVMAVREVWGPDPTRVLAVAAACCDAEPPLGDPTEVALLTAAAARGIHRAELERARPRVDVHPFDSTRKRMSIFRADQRLSVKGAFESVAPLCAQLPADAAAANDAFAARGLRVLAIAEGATRDERDLAFVGLVGLADPPRPEAIAAIAEARAAGIETVMITGDHPVTAGAIAREMGIGRVHARATPEEKLRIVRDWKGRGAIVAMTGDGVNDAPALREAHAGIAMGIGGTEVTRAAADVVLLDDDYASIVAGVKEGRGIFDNIRKTAVYLLAGNFAELALMLAAAVIGVPLPLLPLHLLWLNLVTETLPALALVTDPASPDVMKRPPRPAREAMLGPTQWKALAWAGTLEAAAALAVYLWALRALGLDAARALAFDTLVFGSLFRAFAARSRTRVFWQTGVFSNVLLLAVVGASVGVQLGLHLVPFTRGLFGLPAPEATALGIAFGAALVPTTVLELRKLFRRPARRLMEPCP